MRVAGHGRLHDADVVGADLVAQASRSAVDHHAHAAQPEPERGGDVFVVDVVDDLYLEEVVAGTQAAHLADAAKQGSFADVPDLGVEHTAVILAVLEVALDAVAALHRVTRSAQQQRGQLDDRRVAATRHPCRVQWGRGDRAHPSAPAFRRARPPR